MKTVLITAALAVSLAAPPLASQARPHRDDHQDHHDVRSDRDHRGGPHRGHPHGMPPGQAKKSWRQGQYIPRSYVVEPTYYVAEPERYRLRAPPPGYRWVRVEDDVYLAQTETGLIADIVRSLFE